jgi:arylsulfatase A-like enzyme
MDPHDPYFVHPYDGRAYARLENPNPDPSLAEEYRKAYEGEVRYLDREIGKLLAFLKEQGLYEETLLLLTSDHGEEFYEHGGWWHGTSLFEEQIWVPLIMKFPRGEGRGLSLDGLAGLIDIAPTLLEAAGLPPGPKMQGRSLLAVLRQKIAAAPFVFAEENLEGHRLFSLRTDRLKWIEANPENPRGLPRESLYDLKEDPGETKDLAPKGHPLGQKLAERLKEVREAALRGAPPSEPVTLDPATRERLRALGYLE